MGAIIKADLAAQSVGSSSHIFAERMNGLLTGEVDYTMVAVSTALSQIAAGKLRALGVTSAKPIASLPNVPPIASILPGYEGLNCHGMHAPAKTPAAIVAKLHDETTVILRRPDVTKQLNGLAMEIAASTPEHYRAFIKAQISLWGPVIKSSGVRAD
jgi:tripartite-type tricarboxylate transporter receptor subunit TctC